MIRIIKALTVSLVICLLLALAVPVLGGETGQLKVKVLGFENSEGFGMIAVSNSSEAYEASPDQAVAKAQTPITGNQTEAEFKLPYGWYAVSVYHDENGNAKLDTNPLGIPKEAYGFSNDARGTFGPPEWDKVKFELDSPEMEIVINVK